MKHIATYQIQDTFKITGRGIVFSGFILDGKFMTGDFIRFTFKGEQLERKIKGIDVRMRVIEGKPHVGVLIESTNEKEIDDLRNWKPQKTIGKIYSLREVEIDQSEKMKTNKSISKNLNGIIQMLLSLLWISHYAILFYNYHFADILYTFKYPNWTLLIFFLMGVLGLLIGYFVYVGKKSSKIGYLNILGILIFGVTIDLLVNY